MDRRYIQAYDHQGAAPVTPQGSGWGKFGTGTLSNQYVAVLSGSLYDYDLTDAALSRGLAASGLAGGDWFWQQFANYLYGVNATDGVGRKLIGSGTDGHGDWGLVKLPDAPTDAPTAPLNSGASVPSIFTGGTLVVSGSPTQHTIRSDGSIYVVWGSSGAGPQTISITFKTAGPDNRPDWTYHDILLNLGYQSPGFPTLELDVYSTELGTASVRAQPWHVNNAGPAFRINNIARDNRGQITKLVYSTTVPSNGGYVQILPPTAEGVWLSLAETTTVGPNDTPTLQPLQYEYTYYDSTTGLESAPSPQLLIPANQQSLLGEWRDVTCTTGGTADTIRVYRRIEAGGAITRYRLGELVNSGGVQVWTDMLAADEVSALPVFIPSVIPPSGVTAITAWLNRLCVAQGALVLISRDDNPLAFTEDGVVFDPSDASRALTFYPDDKQAETVLAFVAEDALYIVTDQSVRCLFGTTPDNWRLIKIEGAEGACGPRAVCGYKNGALVLTSSGRLMYYSLGLTSTYTIGAVPRGLEVSKKVRARIGNPGIKALATSDAVVSVHPDGEIEVRNGTGAYFVMDVDGNWRSGTHTHPTHSTLFITGLPLRWIGNNGYLYQGGDDAYQSDGGTTGDNGTPVFFNVITREERFPRSNLTNLYVRANQTLVESSPGGPMKVLYPRVTPITKRNEDDPKAYSPALPTATSNGDKRNIAMPAKLNGEEMYFILEGDKDTVYREVRASFEQSSPARNL